MLHILPLPGNIIRSKSIESQPVPGIKHSLGPGLRQTYATLCASFLAECQHQNVKIHTLIHFSMDTMKSSDTMASKAAPNHDLLLVFDRLFDAFSPLRSQQLNRALDRTSNGDLSEGTI
jgi:hypothetical protein